MNRVWPWVAGFVVTLLLIILIGYGSPGREARYRFPGAYGPRTAMSQGQLDAAAQKALVLHLLAVRARR